ncbi:MAG: hypothetical protein IJ002_04090 [Clostridia bacterium]|nr:hypothetical protein [Clostridia bacterium]
MRDKLNKKRLLIVIGQTVKTIKKQHFTREKRYSHRVLCCFYILKKLQSLMPQELAEKKQNHANFDRISVIICVKTKKRLENLINKEKNKTPITVRPAWGCEL